MQAKGLVRILLVALLLICVYQFSFTFATQKVERKSVTFAKAQCNLVDAEKDVLKKVENSACMNEYKEYYLDSVSDFTALNFGFGKTLTLGSYSYLECKNKELGLGLDLQGGMSAILSVGLEELLKGLSIDGEDPKLDIAIEKAKELEKTNDENFIANFDRAWKQENPGIALNTVFASNDNGLGLTLSSSDKDVLAALNEKADGAIKNTYEILKARIDEFGVRQPNVSLQPNTGRIIVELPGVKNRERARDILEKVGNLEFWHTYDVADIVVGLEEANTAYANKLKREKGNVEAEETDTSKTATNNTNVNSNTNNVEADPLNALIADQAKANAKTDTNKIDTLLTIDEDSAALANLIGGDEGEDTVSNTNLSPEEFRAQYPLYSILNPEQNSSSIIGYIPEKDLEKFYEIMADPTIASAFGKRDVMWIRGAKPIQEMPDYVKNNIAERILEEHFMKIVGRTDINEKSKLYPIYAIQTKNKDEAPLTGEVVKNAGAVTGQNGGNEVTLNMDQNGAKIWKKMTQIATVDPNGGTNHRSIAIVLDNKVFSAPEVNGVIAGGSSSISGMANRTEANDLAAILQAGSLPAPPQIIEEQVVGPTLGEESVTKGLRSIIIGLLMVLVFMILYYNGAGLVADLVLLLNLVFILGYLSSEGAALTLPGIAGIVLTIGMAVDANVLIFERIKEELLKGKGLKLSIRDGYKQSYSAIIDANLTTLLTGFILLAFGIGPVKGFAVVLVAGIVSSLFTAILASRLIIDWRTAKDKTISFSNAMTAKAFRGLKYNFLGKRKFTYIASAIFILIGIASMFINKFDMGVEFTGGRTYVVRFQEAVNTGDLTSSLGDALDGFPVEVKTFGGADQVRITTSYLSEVQGKEAGNQAEAALYGGLSSYLPSGTDLTDFTTNYLQSSQVVGPTISDDITKSSIISTVLALLGIFLYILIRFRNWRYGLAAVVTIIHDVMILLTCFTLFKNFTPFALEINQAFIAALLTVIGYSINDTVVVFDRIREYLAEFRSKSRKEVINMAVNDTLSRTLITSLTTLLVILILFIFGGEVIRGFAFALLIGVIVGTYSSIFIATPIVVDLSKDERTVIKAPKKSKTKAKIA